MTTVMRLAVREKPRPKHRHTRPPNHQPNQTSTRHPSKRASPDLLAQLAQLVLLGHLDLVVTSDMPGLLGLLDLLATLDPLAAPGRLGPREVSVSEGLKGLKASQENAGRKAVGACQGLLALVVSPVLLVPMGKMA